jgi:hypothetical protein
MSRSKFAYSMSRRRKKPYRPSRGLDNKLGRLWLKSNALYRDGIYESLGKLSKAWMLAMSLRRLP